MHYHKWKQLKDRNIINVTGILHMYYNDIKRQRHVTVLDSDWCSQKEIVISSLPLEILLVVERQEPGSRIRVVDPPHQGQLAYSCL